MNDLHVIEELKQFDGPTIINGLEFFDIRVKTSGFMSPGIRKVFANDRRTVGYAFTAKISAMHPPTDAQKKLADLYYTRLHDAPRPALSVIQDIDPEPVGSFWGEVQATTHKALGCTAVITSGGVRDLDEVRALEFEYYASCILVSHAYVHIEDVGCPVSVGGLTVLPGDLLHADKHGVVVIPPEVVPYLADACRAAQDAELPVLENCRKHFEKPPVPIDDLLSWRAEMLRRRAAYTKKFSALIRKP